VTPVIPPLHRDLDFNSPLSAARAAKLIGTLDARGSVLDLGCGWAELLLQVLVASPDATGIGVDRDEDAIAHARDLAQAKGVVDRVTLTAGDAVDWTGEPADVALNVGASHVFGGDEAEHTATTLAAYRKRLAPGGRLLLGEAFWRTPPSAEAMAFFGGDTGQYGTLGELVQLAHDHGYRLLAVSEATLDEWDDFQSRYLLGYERWLVEHPDDAEIRAKADDARAVPDRVAWRARLRLPHPGPCALISSVVSASSPRSRRMAARSSRYSCRPSRHIRS
jgi:cyclopropane fatty-acyl-phospholipid synthase-like methyltransferase